MQNTSDTSEITNNAKERIMFMGYSYKELQILSIVLIPIPLDYIISSSMPNGEVRGSQGFL